MNRQRRTELKAVLEALEELRSQIEDIYDREEEAYENMPESLQESERGETMSEGMDVYQILTRRSTTLLKAYTINLT